MKIILKTMQKGTMKVGSTYVRAWYIVTVEEDGTEYKSTTPYERMQIGEELARKMQYLQDQGHEVTIELAEKKP